MIPELHLTTRSYFVCVRFVVGMVSSPSMALESSSLVLVYGLDVYFTRVSPSKGFDLLSSDFNRPLLTAILAAMAAIVLVLRRIYRRKVVAQAWA